MDMFEILLQRGADINLQTSVCITSGWCGIYIIWNINIYINMIVIIWNIWMMGVTPWGKERSEVRYNGRFTCAKMVFGYVSTNLVILFLIIWFYIDDITNINWNIIILLFFDLSQKFYCFTFFPFAMAKEPLFFGFLNFLNLMFFESKIFAIIMCLLWKWRIPIFNKYVVVLHPIFDSEPQL